MTVLLVCGIIAFHPDYHRPVRLCVPLEMIRHMRIAGSAQSRIA